MRLRYTNELQHLSVYFEATGNSARHKVKFAAIINKSPPEVKESDLHKWSELAGYAPCAYGFEGGHYDRLAENLWIYHWQTYASTGD
jgi:hypothetical protein